MTKVKNKVTLVCSCGNKKAWAIIATGGHKYTSDGHSYSARVYWIQCGLCDSKAKLGETA